MSDPVAILLAWLAGGVLGTVFFGGLWWTVRKVVSAKQPALWVFCSLILRTSTALAGLYLVSGGHWDRLLLCLLGFVMARPLVMHLARSTEKGPLRAATEATHAP